MHTLTKEDGIEYVLVPIHEYKELIKNQRLLEALELGHVTSWDGYSYAIQEFYPEYFEEE